MIYRAVCISSGRLRHEQSGRQDEADKRNKQWKAAADTAAPWHAGIHSGAAAIAASVVPASVHGSWDVRARLGVYKSSDMTSARSVLIRGRCVALPFVGNVGSVLTPELPTLPASAGALVFDQAGRLLILKPTYKSGWTIPGGVMKADGETPWDACRREVREECGIEVTGGRLACVDFRPGRPGHPGGIRFLFDCGVADDVALAAIRVQPEEIAEYRLVPLNDAFALLRKPIRCRVRAATRHRRCIYLENGRPVPGIR